MALKIIKTTIEIGLPSPVKLLHITDTHLTREDQSGWKRTEYFDVDYEGCCEEYFLQALDYAKKNDLLILHTGDLVDFLSDGNFACVDQHFSGLDYIYAAGNHDFCHLLKKRVTEETYEYKWEHIKTMAPHIRNNLYFYSRVVGGVNIVAMDDSYYKISQGQIDALKAEAARGYPIILAMHVPLFSEELAKAVYAKGEPCAWQIDAPESYLEKYAEDWRWQQTPDEITKQAVQYIKREPMIKAIITGHTHLNFEEKLTEHLWQYTTHGSYAGYVREITII